MWKPLTFFKMWMMGKTFLRHKEAAKKTISCGHQNNRMRIYAECKTLQNFTAMLQSETPLNFWYYGFIDQI